jgi:hypothetical protein
MSAPCAAWCAAAGAHRSRLADISTRNKLSRIDEKLTVLERQGAPRRAAPRPSTHPRRSCPHHTSGLSRSCAGPASRAPAAGAASRARRGKRASLALSGAFAKVRALPHSPHGSGNSTRLRGATTW